MNRSAEAMTVAVVRERTPGTRGSMVYYVLRSAWRAVTVSPDFSALLARSTASQPCGCGAYSNTVRRRATGRAWPAAAGARCSDLRTVVRRVTLPGVRARPFPTGLHRGQSATGSPSVFVAMKC